MRIFYVYADLRKKAQSTNTALSNVTDSQHRFMRRVNLPPPPGHFANPALHPGVQPLFYIKIRHSLRGYLNIGLTARCLCSEWCSACPAKARLSSACVDSNFVCPEPDTNKGQLRHDAFCGSASAPFTNRRLFLSFF